MNLTSHTYQTTVANGIANDILTRFYPAFVALELSFAVLKPAELEAHIELVERVAYSRAATR